MAGRIQKPKDSGTLEHKALGDSVVTQLHDPSRSELSQFGGTPIKELTAGRLFTH